MPDWIDNAENDGITRAISSQGFAYTPSAITEGQRAVDDLPAASRRRRERQRVSSAA